MQTAVVYQLQRRIRILREQLQRKDLHLDLLRRKLSVQVIYIHSVFQRLSDLLLSKSSLVTYTL